MGAHSIPNPGLIHYGAEIANIYLLLIYIFIWK